MKRFLKQFFFILQVLTNQWSKQNNKTNKNGRTRTTHIQPLLRRDGCHLGDGVQRHGRGLRHGQVRYLNDSVQRFVLPILGSFSLFSVTKKCCQTLLIPRIEDDNKTHYEAWGSQFLSWIVQFDKIFAFFCFFPMGKLFW